MYCRKCGKQIEDNVKFCRYCGAELEGEDKAAEKSPKGQQKAEILPEKRKGRGVIAAVLAVLVLLAVIGTVLFLSQQDKEHYEVEPKTVLHTTEYNNIAKLEIQFIEKITLAKEEQKKAEEEKKKAEEEKKKKEEEKAHADDILPKSDKILLAERDLAELSAEQLRLARNEIYASHGYIFQDGTLKMYFGGKSWYKPVSESIPDSQLNEYERANLQLILAVEEKRNGWKAAYKDFLENSPEMEELRNKYDTSEWGGEYWGFELMYLDNDDVPELVFVCPNSQMNYSILTYYNGTINSYLECFVAQGTSVTYLEREGWIRHEHAMMGHKMDEIYYILAGQLEKRYVGFISYQNPSDDWNAYEIPSYNWEDVRNENKTEGEGEEAYLSEVHQVFDSTRAKGFSCSLSLAELYQILDAE